MLRIFWILLFIYLSPCLPQDFDSLRNELAVSFDDKYGQIEIGGKYVGAEFHNSFPLPSRISFYYPVANSIDLSTDYWKRDESQPLNLRLAFDGITEQLGIEPFSYRYAPFFVEFKQTKSTHQTIISYYFCEDLPVMIFRLKIKNLLKEEKEVKLTSHMKCSLRTCHRYSFKKEAKISYQKDGEIALVNFDYPETDSTQIFVLNSGERPISRLDEDGFREIIDPVIEFEYKKTLQPIGELTIIQLIGSCRQPESDEVISRALQTWETSVLTNEQKVLQYVFDQSYLMVDDPSLMQTAQWSKAVMASNTHYINGQIVPMPCPAEYNYFFTHDLLLTNLGAVFFDGDRVKKNLLYLYSLTQADSILPHAYYWRDSDFQTEFCGSDNWNHLWFIILTSSYLKHAADIATVESLYPILKKSLNMMLQNKGSDNLMYASRPDWWDIGHVYGARTFITTLMIRALREFCYISLKLGYVNDDLNYYFGLSQAMQNQLTEKMWDEKASYLINMLDDSTVDRHYYSGSLLATAFHMLDNERTNRLLVTARSELLDQNIGIRNVMPADFHNLIDVYKFKGMEAGEPYLYMNGGVWPQGNVWYALGWLAVGQPDTAKMILEKYHTIAGIRNSPNGQPSFFEYRNADANSPKYGEIDKPTFLWAAGLYLHGLYQLAGVRENEWNIAFAPLTPSDWGDVEYDLLFSNSLVRIDISGSGKYFRKILFDGEESNSAVLTSPIKKVVLERGIPQIPYLAQAECVVKKAQYSKQIKRFEINVEGFVGQLVRLKIISPFKPQMLFVDSKEMKHEIQITEDGKVFNIKVELVLKREDEKIVIQF